MDIYLIKIGLRFNTKFKNINNVFWYDTRTLVIRTGQAWVKTVVYFTLIIDVDVTGKQVVIVANTCTGVIRVDAKLSQINKMAQPVTMLDSIKQWCIKIFIDRVVHGLNSYTVEIGCAIIRQSQLGVMVYSPIKICYRFYRYICNRFPIYLSKYFTSS